MESNPVTEELTTLNNDDKHPGGRPRKLTRFVVKKLLQGLSRGLTLVSVCKAVGVSVQLVHNYRHAHPKFAVAVERARYRAIDKHLRRLIKLADSADDSTKARISIWFLEHLPQGAESYARNRVEVTGPEGGPIDLSVGLTILWPHETKRVADSNSIEALEAPQQIEDVTSEVIDLETNSSREGACSG